MSIAAMAGIDLTPLDPGRPLLRFDNVQSLKQTVASFLDLSDGSSELDLGCGRGTDLIAIGAEVPLSGKLVGIDTPAESLATVKA